MTSHEMNAARFTWNLYCQLRRDLKFTRAEAYAWLKQRGYVPPGVVESKPFCPRSPSK